MQQGKRPLDCIVCCVPIFCCLLLDMFLQLAVQLLSCPGHTTSIVPDQQAHVLTALLEQGKSEQEKKNRHGVIFAHFKRKFLRDMLQLKPCSQLHKVAAVRWVVCSDCPFVSRKDKVGHGLSAACVTGSSKHWAPSAYPWCGHRQRVCLLLCLFTSLSRLLLVRRWNSVWQLDWKLIANDKERDLFFSLESWLLTVLFSITVMEIFSLFQSVNVVEGMPQVVPELWNMSSLTEYFVQVGVSSFACPVLSLIFLVFLISFL